MAQSHNTVDASTVTIEIYHGAMGVGDVADVRCFGADELTQDVFDEHYTALGEPVELDVDAIRRELADVGNYEPIPTIRVLEQIWIRTQGGRVDDELPYDGSLVRSSCVGDVVVLDGQPWIVADVGFEQIELDVGDELQDDVDDAAARAEIQAEADALARYERHVDRQGHF